MWLRQDVQNPEAGAHQDSGGPWSLRKRYSATITDVNDSLRLGFWDLGFWGSLHSWLLGYVTTG